MAYRAVLSQIQIPVVCLGIQAQLADAGKELVIIVFTLGAAHDLTDARYQAVYCRHGPVVVVELHVEGFDLLRIVRYKERSAVDLLGKETLMFGLQVTAPLHLVFKLVVVLLQDLDRLGIGHSAELAVHDLLKTFDQALLDEAVKELHLLGSILQDVADQVLDHCFLDPDQVVQICKCHLRLDHPELGRMSRRVGILSAEGRSEGIDIAERFHVSLDVELAGNGQEGRLAEEVFCIIDFLRVALSNAVQVQRRDLEHLARALAVGCRDQRRVHIYESSFLIELVDRICKKRTYSENRHKGIGALSQMGQRTEILE